MSSLSNYDVIVAGGGLAGLAVARQIRLARPQTRIAVVEKRDHPAPEAAFKVGESVAEIGAHYLKEGIQFRDHMEEEHLRKFSLRVFSTSDGNHDIARRPEVGLGRISPLRTYQIDRGRLENALAAAVSDAGIDLLDGQTVSKATLGTDRHTVTVKRGNQSRELACRWLLDASGRAGLLRRQLGLGVEIPHDVNAAWFRLPHPVKIDDWSSDVAWHNRVPGHKRWLSTCHLVGEGYWIWLIALPSGGHSVGVVADPRYVPYERIRRYPELLDWARENEPQLASKLPDSEAGLLDFRKVKNYAYGTRRGISPQRWALVGEAGLFLDPLYATGMDFIAVSNTLATRLVCGSLDDEPDLRKRMKAYNAYYLGQYLGWAPAFAGQYSVFGDAQATAAKVLWDNLSYFMYPVLIFNQGCVLDYEFVAKTRQDFKAHFAMNVYMQRFFREWSTHGTSAKEDAGFVVGSDYLVGELFRAVAEPLTKPEVGELVQLNVERLRSVASEMVTRMSDAAGGPVDPPPFELAGPDLTGEDLLDWYPYAQRTVQPADAVPQPEDAWLIR